VRVILTLFALAGGVQVIGDAYAIAFAPDEYVFVDREGPRAEVWRDVWAFQADTGKKWIEQPPGTTDVLATYHGIARQRALGSGGAHLLLLILSVVALRRVRASAGARGTPAVRAGQAGARQVG
jgi:hypothetical protein